MLDSQRSLYLVPEYNLIFKSWHGDLTQTRQTNMFGIYFGPQHSRAVTVSETFPNLVIEWPN